MPRQVGKKTRVMCRIRLPGPTADASLADHPRRINDGLELRQGHRQNDGKAETTTQSRVATAVGRFRRPPRAGSARVRVRPSVRVGEGDSPCALVVSHSFPAATRATSSPDYKLVLAQGRVLVLVATEVRTRSRKVPVQGFASKESRTPTARLPRQVVRGLPRVLRCADRHNLRAGQIGLATKSRGAGRGHYPGHGDEGRTRATELLRAEGSDEFVHCFPCCPLPPLDCPSENSPRPSRRTA